MLQVTLSLRKAFPSLSAPRMTEPAWFLCCVETVAVMDAITSYLV